MKINEILPTIAAATRIANEPAEGASSHCAAQSGSATHGIYQWGELKFKANKAKCREVAKRWTEKHGNVDLEVLPLQNH